MALMWFWFWPVIFLLFSLAILCMNPLLDSSLSCGLRTVLWTPLKDYISVLVINLLKHNLKQNKTKKEKEKEKKWQILSNSPAGAIQPFIINNGLIELDSRRNPFNWTIIVEALQTLEKEATSPCIANPQWVHFSFKMLQ